MDQRPAVLYTDPEGEVPWAMQLVARVERAEPGATHTATCEAAAAAGHGAQLAALRMEPDRCRRWAEAGFPVLVEHPGRTRWSALVGGAPVEVVDAGFTVVAPGTRTAVAWWDG